jgi:hypothetical protein
LQSFAILTRVGISTVSSTRTVQAFLNEILRMKASTLIQLFCFVSSHAMRANTVNLSEIPALTTLLCLSNCTKVSARQLK